MKLDILLAYGHIKPSTALGGVMRDNTQTWFLQKVGGTFMLYNKNASRVRGVAQSREPISAAKAMRLVRQDFKDRGYKVLGMDRIVMVTVVPIRPAKKPASQRK